MQPIPPFDPKAPKSIVLRSMSAFARSKIGSWLFQHVAAPLDPKLMRMSNGRVKVGVGPRVNLTTRGRKSGELRTITLGYFTQEGDVILIASSFGRDADPAWFLNLKADPSATLAWRGGSGTYTAREAVGEERDALFDLAVLFHSGYAKYQAGTARKIPIVVLSPN